MGCRLHHAKKYKIEWEGGWFNWSAEQFREILSALEVHVWDATNQEDDYGAFEISLDEWKELGSKLASVSKGEYDHAVLGDDYTGEEYLITWRQFIDWFKAVDAEYDKDNDYIRFEWF